MFIFVLSGGVDLFATSPACLALVEFGFVVCTMFKLNKTSYKEKFSGSAKRKMKETSQSRIKNFLGSFLFVVNIFMVRKRQNMPNFANVYLWNHFRLGFYYIFYDSDLVKILWANLFVQLTFNDGNFKIMLSKILSKILYDKALVKSF